MKVAQVLLTLFFLIGLANAGRGGRYSRTNSNGRSRWSRNRHRTRRYNWDNDGSVDEEADQASDEVRNDWDQALATFSPMDLLDDLEKLQLYNEWKAEAREIVRNEPNARFKIKKDCEPLVKFFNTFAKKNACTNKESEAFVDRLGKALNGILSASELEAEQSWGTSHPEESDNGGHRELCRCPGCRGGYYCRQVCGCRRRRLEGDSDEVTILNNTPEGLEAMVAALIAELLGQCETQLHNIAEFSNDIQPTCRDALKAIKCEVIVDVWKLISIVVNGEEHLAEDMIEEKLSKNRAQ